MTKRGLRTFDARADVLALEALAGDEGDVACAILKVVLRHDTPSVRPDDVLAGLRSRGGLHDRADASGDSLGSGPARPEHRHGRRSTRLRPRRILTGADRGERRDHRVTGLDRRQLPERLAHRATEGFGPATSGPQTYSSGRTSSGAWAKESTCSTTPNHPNHPPAPPPDAAPPAARRTTGRAEHRHLRPTGGDEGSRQEVGPRR